MRALGLVFLALWGQDMIADNCDKFPNACVVECSEAEPIANGEIATCAGILIPMGMAQDAAQSKISLSRCQELSGHQAKICKIEQKALEDRLKSAQEARAKAEELAQEAAKQPKPEAWYLQPSFVAPVAFVVGVLAGLAAR